MKSLHMHIFITYQVKMSTSIIRSLSECIIQEILACRELESSHSPYCHLYNNIITDYIALYPNDIYFFM